MNIDQKGNYPVVQVPLPSPLPKLDIMVQSMSEATAILNSFPPLKKESKSDASSDVDDLSELMSKVSTKPHESLAKSAGKEKKKKKEWEEHN